MKRNAIIRIILFSVTILVLLSILVAGLTLRHRDGLLKPVAASPMETVFPAHLDSPEAASPTVSPKAEAEAELTVSPTGEDVQRFPADQLRQLKIEWAAGSVVLAAGDGEDIEVSESGGKYPMHIKQQNGKLTISYCEDSLLKSFGGSIEKKDLTVYVPRLLTLDSLEVETASASVRINDLTVREVEIDAASGESTLENCTLEKLDLDTASGDLRFYGTLDELECDAASGSVYAVLKNTPSRIDMDAASGNLDLTLPEDAGFTAEISGMSSNFTSDFATTMQNGRHLCGDGRCRIQMDAMSGDVVIRKGL